MAVESRVKSNEAEGFAAEIGKLFASPCHQVALERGRVPHDGERPDLLCSACHRAFGSTREGVYDFRLPSIRAAEISTSFGVEWRRHVLGEFEEGTIYGYDPGEELADFLRAFRIEERDVAGKWILDAGCGSARLGRTLGRLNANVVSLDLVDSIRLVSRAQPVPNVHYVQADLTYPPFRPESFDYVWSEGALQASGAAAGVFAKLAPLVRRGGALSVWVYSAEVSSWLFTTRRLLPFANRLPEPILMVLCKVLAMPLWLAYRGRGLLGSGPSTLPSLGTLRFNLYDELSPRYESRHTYKEVSEWFSRAEFAGIRKWSDLGVCGVRQ